MTGLNWVLRFIGFNGLSIAMFVISWFVFSSTLPSFAQSTPVIAALAALQGKLSSIHSQQSRNPEDRADADGDGLVDAVEQELAERYAPIVFHDRDEPNLPTNVERFLAQTQLFFYDERCEHRVSQKSSTLERTIPRHIQPACDRSESPFDSHGTRSKNKQRSFFLENVDSIGRQGSLDSRDWTTYFHAYSNEGGGVTVQYWRFYAYNTGLILGLKTGLGSHGGDWEAIHVVLDDKHIPTVVRFLGHRKISSKSWLSLLRDGDHPMIKSEKGGHTSRPLTQSDEKKANRFIRQQTWTGGKVIWSSSRSGAGNESGPLLNLGEKLAPFRGMEFIQYSGLWGSRKTSKFFSRFQSGYWGPAYNETGLGKDHFITAWCAGMKAVSTLTITRECYPSSISR